MSETCAACGRPIVAVPAIGPPITLDWVWRHRSWWANRTHAAIPRDDAEEADSEH